MTEKRKILMAICSGLLLALTMPKPGWSVLAWVALVPLLAALDGARWTRAALLGFLAGFVYFIIILYWIWLFGYLPWVLLAIVQALYCAIFAVIAARLMPSRVGCWGYVAVPAAWTAMQWSRSLGAYAFPWGGFAHVLANDAPVIQMASITGAWGIEFLVCALNLTIAETVIHRRKTWMGAAVPVAVAAVVLAGVVVASRTQGISGSPQIAIVQQNMPHETEIEEGYVEDSFETCARMSFSVAYKLPDLVVWPESAIPTDITDDYYGAALPLLAKAIRADFLVGGYNRNEQRGASYNSAYLYGLDGRRRGIYRKVHLVPFGEFVPLRDSLSFLNNYAIRDEDVLPGREHVLLDSKIGKLGISICFESLFPQIAQLETKRGAEVLVVTTNDSWFRRTQAARQHLMMSKLRAVENRRYVIRAALTGISTVIDPWGRSVKEIGLYKRGVLSAELTPRSELTIFTRFGHYFAYLCALIVLGSLIWAAAEKRGIYAAWGGQHKRPAIK